MLTHAAYIESYNYWRSHWKPFPVSDLESRREIMREDFCSFRHLLVPLQLEYQSSFWLALRDEIASRLDREFIHEQIGYDD
jgi:hypothetical protein